MHNTQASRTDSSLKEKLDALYLLRAQDEKPINGFRPAYLSLLHSLNDPHLHLPPVIHVAGTNGKGSTIAFMRAILEQAGYRVHAYTSPHLQRFNERIVLAGQEIPDDMLERLIDEVTTGNPITFFEIATAIAFLAFSRTPADIVLLETGLGGRLDCTNVIPAPLATIITPISHDHMEFLGHSLIEIAQEKAGIIKKGSLCVTAPQEKAARDVLEKAAKQREAAFYPHNDHWEAKGDDTHMTLKIGADEFTYPRPALIGDHQVTNAGTAVTCLKSLPNFKITEHHIAEGLQAAHWPARLECIKSGALYDALPAGWELWYDGGHNEAGALALATQADLWQEADNKPLHIILGMKRAKDPINFMKHLSPYTKHLSIAAYDDFYTYDELSSLLKNTVSCPISRFESAQAYSALHGNKTEGRILICGSLYFKNMPHIL
jgi:dihydrofolate synthase/folylpolyglutamate synthase